MDYKPRIGLLHYSYRPVIGGVEIIVSEYANLFVKYGYDLTVFCADGKSDNPKIKLVNQPEFASLTKVNNDLYQQIYSEKQYPQEFYTLKKIILDKIEILFKEIDILIAHNILSLNLNPCLSSALTDYFNIHKEKKLISWVHDIPIELTNEVTQKKSFENKDLEKNIYSPLQNINYVCISNYLKHTLTNIIGFPKQPLTVISNGINIDSFLNLEQATTMIIQKYKLDQADLLIYLPSKILRHKNTDLTIKVFAEVLKKYKNSYLIISGKANPHTQNPTYVEEVLQLIKDLNLEKKVIFIVEEMLQNNVSYDFDVIKDFYRFADIVLLLSSQENFGLPVIEAGLSKTQIVCSDKEIFKEVAGNNIHYVDILNNNPSQIASTVVKVAENPQIRLSQKIRKQYDFDLIFVNQTVPYINKIWQKKY